MAGDNNNQPDVFLFDRLTGTNTLISVNQNGGGSGNDRSGTPIISADGSTVVFKSVASDLVGGDLNSNQDVFLSRVSVVTPASRISPQAAVTLSTGQITIMWQSAPGRSYRVQYKDDLSQANWNDLEGGVIVNGSRAACRDARAGMSNQRFYRVALVE